MEFDENMELEESRTQAGMKQFGNILAIGIILIVAAFGDVMYLQLMSGHLPGGFLMGLCYVGAFTSFAAVAYMLIGKSLLFTPGLQMVVAWFVFLLELSLIALNIILVFQSDGANSTGFLAAWLQFAPATPVANMAGVAILFFLDEAGLMRHEDMELAMDMKRARRRHFKATAKARLRLQDKQLNYLVTEMNRAVASPESMESIRLTAIEMNQHLLGQLSGGRTYRVPAGLPAGKTVESDPLPPTTPPQPAGTKKTESPSYPSGATPAAYVATSPATEKKRGIGAWIGDKLGVSQQSVAPLPTADQIAAAMLELMKKQQSTQPQFADPSPAAHADAPEQRPEPVTDHLALPSDPGFAELVEQLSPLAVTPTGTNGNGANGHSPK